MRTLGQEDDVLLFDGATVGSGPAGIDFLVLDGRLGAGALWLVETETVDQEAALIDAAVGLRRPEAGRVRFRTHDWSLVPATFRDALRGGIGLIPRQGGLLTYTDMACNILLAARFHRRDGDDVLLEEARHLAARFGLPGLPSGVADRVSALDALRANCVRAFLAEPWLVIVESRAAPWWPEFVQPLIDSMQVMRERGGAVIWCLRNDPLFDDPAVPASSRWRLGGRTLRRVG